VSRDFKKLLYGLSALVDLGQEVTSSKDFKPMMRSMLHAVMGAFVVTRGAVYSYDTGRGAFALVASKGFSKLARVLKADPAGLRGVKNLPVMLGKGEGPLHGSTMHDRLFGCGAYVLAPLWAKDELMGALVLGNKYTAEPYNPEDLELLRAVANQIAICLHNHYLFNDLSEKLAENKRLYEELRVIYHDTIQAFVAAIDAKDPYTKNHSYRVARYVVAIAKELGWSENDIEGIYMAGLLHDVGKIVISDSILKTDRRLSAEEIEEMKKHPELSYKILSKIKFPWKDVVHTVRHHHERLDGRGYPDAVNSESLSESVRMLTLADSFDAMTTNRPYRGKMKLKMAIEELKRCINTQFDSNIMSAFCRVLEKEIKGELPEPNILPHLEVEFDPADIKSMLEAIREELAVER